VSIQGGRWKSGVEEKEEGNQRTKRNQKK